MSFIMEELQSIPAASFPYLNLTKVCDLLYFDGPILTHFRDENGEDILFYWVDYDENYNRWMVFKVYDFELFDYLKSKISLRALILQRGNNFLCIVDIDTDSVYQNTQFIEVNKLAQSYLPSETSFYSIAIPELYDSLIEKYSTTEYIETLRKYSVYLKLDPIGLKYKNSLAVDTIIEFLQNVSHSFKHYAGKKFAQSFFERFVDETKLEKTIRRVIQQVSPRVVDLSYNSFGIGIASDILNDQENMNGLLDWKKSILYNYKSEVIEVDFDSTEALDRINYSYSRTEIENIFKPIIEILNSKEYSISIGERSITSVKRLHRVPVSTIDKILPPLPKIAELTGTKLVNLIAEIPENRDIRTMKPKALYQNMLFYDDNVTEIPSSYRKIAANNWFLEFNTPLEVTIKKISDNQYSIDYAILKISTNAPTIQQVKADFEKKIVDLYLASTIENITIDEAVVNEIKKLVKSANQTS